MLPASAQTIVERLVSPGPLSEAHKEFESTCSSCHLSFDKKAQAKLCLDCHEEIANDFQQSTGFHGKSPDIDGTVCKNCHTEHEGFSFDIIEFDQASFDHALTDYPLKGGHLTVDCAECHLPGKKFSEAPLDCFSCHREDEPHRGNLGEDCESCHNVKDWAQVEFDHSMTEFPLLGKHQTASCEACHVDEVYEGLSSICIDCHKDDDVHEGAFGNDCSTCHTPSSWSKTVFDHGQETGFSLTGGHGKIDCSACHISTLFEPKLSQDCNSCHKQDDTHKGRNGTECADCHVTSSWAATKFDHDKNTKFKLRGSHSAIACEGCHLEAVTEVLPGVDCIDCHKEDDPHQGGQGENCSVCHNEVSWVENTRFDHDLSRFPLLGKHTDVECGSCHQSKRFQDAPLECVACHLDDDSHEGALGEQCDVCHNPNAWALWLGEQCDVCHNPNAWALWIFDHNTQTDFDLVGAHEGLTCASCHKGTAKEGVSQSTDCIACHRADDKHRGAYGTNCERCHNTSNFKSIKFP